MPGMGKTTIAKSFCNLNFENFDGKVYHLEFALRGHSMDSKNFKLLTKSLQGQRVLLVLDNIQTEESIDILKYFLQADLGEKSWILLSARSVDVLKNFNDLQSCMSVPGLEEKEAIAILLERTSLAESSLEAENRGFALQCANRCLFKEISFNSVRGADTFHPLALKTFGRYLFSKYGSDLSKWVPELDVLVAGKGVGLDDMFTVLDKVFEDMDPRYQTIFMLLSVYIPPNMSPLKVAEWLAVNCKEEIDFIEEAVEDLVQKGFIEEIKPEIRIHDLYAEFAQSKARKMVRWLWCKGDPTTSEARGVLISEDGGGFELIKLEYCQNQDLSKIGDKYVNNLWALQVVAACKEMNNLGLSSMKNIRSLIIHNCEFLEVLQGMENLPHLAWFQIVNVPKLKVLNLSSLSALEYIEINTSGPTELGDLTGGVSLREIYVLCPSLSEFPRINGLPYLEKAKFKACEEVNGPLDCRACVNLQSTAFENCWQMAHIPLIDGCSSISKIVLNRCDQVTECSDEDESSALGIVKLCISSEDASATGNSECCDGLNNVPLWNIVISTDVPSLRRFSNLTVLKLYNCDICQAPDVACCGMLEDVCFSTLKNLDSFPDFSSLWKLKKLCLCNCQRDRDPPDIGGCYSLQVFHLLYNDNLKALPKMDGWHPFEEIKLSWQSEEVFDYSDSYEYDDIEFCLDYQREEIFRNINDIFMPVELKKWQWIQRKAVRVKQYFRGMKAYYFITAPSELYGEREARKQACNADPLDQAINHRASGISGKLLIPTLNALFNKPKSGKILSKFYYNFIMNDWVSLFQ
ncbi:uncharacterized protein LOC131855891 [Cryptomeria japonica]|uniref:uncharacterized protein LOC131855891 n=1 Tax=Cryptomeria japonica TaxID=3369 RepID=UPI0027DA1FBA|nr:uncharacterized protein LOC131855891 [Cryptomeria japonica]